LARSSPFLTHILQTQVNHQLRSRTCSSTGQIVIEQWIPSLRCWLTNGLYPPSTPAAKIVSDLLAGDPTRKTADEELADRREASAAIREKNEKEGDDRVASVVSSLSSERVRNFVEVERALHTGETITVRGDDRRTIESLVESTKKAAIQGDGEAQAVLTRGGQADNPTCILSTTNPFQHRHRKEIQPDGQ
jgi:hypothetical protein